MAFAGVPPAYQAAMAGTVITCIFFACVLLLVRPAYGINDDVALIEMIMAGHIAPYVDSSYSSILHFLYAHVSMGVPWYGIWLLCVLGISVALLTGVAIHYYRGYLRLLLVLLILGLNFPFLITLDYSTVGIMGTGSALAVALVLMLRDALTGFRALLLGLLATVSMWLRLEGIVAAVVFTAPVMLTALVICLRRHEARKLFRYVPILLFIAPVAASCAVDQVHKIGFSSPEYREYSAWNSLRGEFHVYPISRINRDNPAVLSATGWSAADYDDLLNWFFIDENIYNVRSMTAFFDTAKRSTLASYSAQYFFGRLSHLAIVYWYYWILMLGAMFLALSEETDDHPQRWIFVFGPIYVFLFIFGMDALLRYPARVAEPSISAFVLAYLFCIIESKKDRGSAGLALPLLTPMPMPMPLLVFPVAMIASGVFFVVQDAYGSRISRASADISYERLLDHLNGKYPGYSILVQPGAGLPTQFQSPLKPYLTEFHPIDAGWQTFSPLFYDQVRELGVDKGYEVPVAMVNNHNALILARADWADRVVDYLHGHGHMPAAHREVVEQIDRRLYLYRLVSP